MEHTNLKEAGEEEEEHDPFIPEDKMHSQHSLTTRDVLNQLFVRNDKGKEVLIVDMGVYTRNRNFRLIYSTKMGKQVFLRPSSINRYIPRTMAESNSIEDKEMTFAWFLSSLVTQVGEFRESESQKVNLLSCEPVPSEDGKSVLFYSHFLTPTNLPRRTISPCPCRLYPVLLLIAPPALLLLPLFTHTAHLFSHLQTKLPLVYPVLSGHLWDPPLQILLLHHFTPRRLPLDFQQSMHSLQLM